MILDKDYVKSSKLITRYQKIYDLGMLISDGFIMSDEMLISYSAFSSSSRLVSGDETPGMQ